MAVNVLTLTKFGFANIIYMSDCDGAIYYSRRIGKQKISFCHAI